VPTPEELIRAVVAEVETLRIPVQFVPGWETRGRPGTFRPRGLVLHHTGLPDDLVSDYPSFTIVRDGRPGLAGPLANFGIGRKTGTVFVFAAGVANHAGGGNWKGLQGNASVWGIDAENKGVGEPWTDVALRTYVALAGALARHTGFTTDMIAGHREWRANEPPHPGKKNKIDPTGIDLDQFRLDVAAFLGGAPPEHDTLREDERNALLFPGAYLQEVKDNKSFVADILSRLDRLDQRLGALSSN
jgi:hypothetical protein